MADELSIKVNGRAWPGRLPIPIRRFFMCFSNELAPARAEVRLRACAMRRLLGARRRGRDPLRACTPVATWWASPSPRA